MFSGIRFVGESGDDEGEGSLNGEESVVDMVVVGDESADSDICVELLSVCLWVEVDGLRLGRRKVCSDDPSRPEDLVSMSTA